MGEWEELLAGDDLGGWMGRDWRGPCPTHAWRIAGAVGLCPDQPEAFRIEPGAGLVVNGDDGRTADLCTAGGHGSCELSLEFCVAKASNSGVYLMGQYEIQILDSWGTPDAELAFHSNGGIYARWVAETRTAYDGHAPRANPSRAPGEWQQLEVLFHAPQFDAAGRRTAGARFERVLLNGVPIHENVVCTGPTRGAWNDDDIPAGPLRLQGDHGPVAYRRIRMRRF